MDLTRQRLLTVCLVLLVIGAGCSRYVSTGSQKDTRVEHPNSPTLRCEEKIGPPDLDINFPSEQNDLELTIIIYRTQKPIGNTTIWYEETFRSNSEVWFKSSSIDDKNGTYNAVMYTNHGFFKATNVNNTLVKDDYFLSIEPTTEGQIKIGQGHVTVPPEETLQSNC